MVDSTKKSVPLSKAVESISHIWKDFYVAKYEETLFLLDSKGKIHLENSFPGLSELEHHIFSNSERAILIIESTAFVLEEKDIKKINLPFGSTYSVTLLKNSFLLSTCGETMSYMLQIRYYIAFEV